MSSAAYVLDPADPRAPTEEQWAAMSPDERRRVVDSLPSEFPLSAPPEGDLHRLPKERAMEALREYYRRLRRRIYLSSELPVYYPDERMFAPDVIAVLDVEPHPRDKWVVTEEQRGLDLAIEVTVSGDARKDLEDNVVRYARLGIPEYFVLEPVRPRLLGYRLPTRRSTTYQPIVPQEGRWPSDVLGLDLALESGRVRFFHGSAPLPEAEELIVRLGAMVDEIVQREQALSRQLDAEHRRAEAEAQRAEAETQRAEAEAQRAERLAERLRKLGVDPDEE